MRTMAAVPFGNLFSRRFMIVAAVGGFAFLAGMSVEPAPAVAGCMDQCMSNCHVAGGRAGCRNKCFRKCEAKGAKAGRG